MAAVNPEPLVARACSRHGLDSSAAAPLTVISAGKAASGMVRGLLRVVPVVRRVLVAAPEHRPEDLPPHVEWVTTSHPSPGDESERAGRRALALASSMPADGRLVVLLSGGASAMLAVPAEGVTLEDKARVASALMKAGASIGELNCVRKHLSAIKGGWLGAAADWRVLTLALSDVHAPVADDPSVIGSGPAVADATTFADALAVIGRYGVDAPPAARVRLEAGARGELPDTPKPGGEAVMRARFEIVGNRVTALSGMRGAAGAVGYEVVTIERATEGQARAAGRRFVEEAARRLAVSAGAVCVIGAGETVVTVTGDGRGGRNQEFVLGAVEALEALAARGLIAVLGSAGSDGLDGPTDAAGGMADTTTAGRARARGISLDDALRRNDSGPALAALGDSITWGATGTNVGDIHVLLARST